MGFWFNTHQENMFRYTVIINLTNNVSCVSHTVSMITFDKPLSIWIHLVNSHHVSGGLNAPLTYRQ